DVYQVISEQSNFEMRVEDVSHLNGITRDNAIHQLTNDVVTQEFDLANDSLLRVLLIKIAELESLVVINLHHIVADGWSMCILIGEINHIYKHLTQGVDDELAPLEVQYADYSHWQNQWMAGKVRDDELKFWKKQLNNVPALHSLPLDYPRPAELGVKGERKVATISSELLTRIKAVCAEQECTLFMFLQTAFALLLSRCSNEDEVVMGTPVAGRNDTALEPLIGFFVNSLVLRTEFDQNETFTQLLTRNKGDILSAFENQHVPFELIVEEINAPRSLSHHPVFQVLFSLQNTEKQLLEIDNVVWNPYNLENGNIKFDLELTATEKSGQIELIWCYNLDLFKEGTILHLVESYMALLNSILDNLDTSVLSLKLIEYEQEVESTEHSISKQIETEW
ncbi:MAG: condensation domain-containing protein, partial [Pseudoalteromonas sp.]|uniref:condensation domain-containing protein n=1 Tax=Pseudoalteromonas sp. TaxID=53249 RepID=UPI0025D8F260